jgi:hypothetical protein
MDTRAIMDAFAATKTGIDLFRGAIRLAKDAKSILPDGEKKEIVSRALEEAEKQIGTAEAQIAQALGYPLCRCIFPPTPMLLVGYWTPGRYDIEHAIAAQLRKAQGGGAVTMDVHECPLCKRNDAGDHRFTQYESKLTDPKGGSAQASATATSAPSGQASTPVGVASPRRAAQPAKPRQG